MSGRIIRKDSTDDILELPPIGKLHIGKKATTANGREYPMSVDYFIPSGKYAELFTRGCGERPSTIQVIFPSDDFGKVCNERLEYRNDKGELVADGDGVEFRCWNGQEYQTFTTREHPRLMEQIANKYPTRGGMESWKEALTLRFVVPAVPWVVGVWELTTNGKASSIRNIRESFDAVQLMRGTVTNTAFDLSVQFHKSNKPGATSKYPVLSLTANDARLEEIQAQLRQRGNLQTLLLPDKEK